ncbi:MAG: arginine--tRNA ligase [Fuerstiella sp.]|nr:arginine--tRNA ligase [Fuerstiella sp.]MCP4858927.1 arginine--tRNA ligase [Fuerstiella sp.]
MSILQTLKSRFASALSSLTEDTAPLLDMIRSSQDPKFGDFQANCAMPLAKQLGRSPRDIAAEIVENLDVSDFCETPEIAGPGFINLRLRDKWIAEHVSRIAGDDRLGVTSVATPRHVVVDFSSPNVAKPMHVGHLRSSVIGDAICRTLRFAGHRVTSDNHIGDWGTQFGMIIYGYRNFVDAAAYSKDQVGELARLYKLVNQLSDYHAAKSGLPELRSQLTQRQTELDQLTSGSDTADKKAKKKLKTQRKAAEETRSAIKSAEARVAHVDADATLAGQANAHSDIARLARKETSKLHAGDEHNQRLWDEFLPACLAALNQIYSRLDVHFDLTLGESYYNPMLADVVSDLTSKGLATDSDGATCVFIEGNNAPFIVQKSDGAYTYATTDLATIQYRLKELNADEIVYVVDKRQSEHFNLLFKTCELWGFGDVKCQHVSFGTVMGDDGKPFKTRSGDNVELGSLIDEAIARARTVVDENDDRREQPALSPDERARVSQIVGTGGIKYADLHHNRDSDYVFDWGKMLATTGDTATYMQYAYARICGIFRELNVDRQNIASGETAVLLTCPEERALALQLTQFDYAVDAVLADYRPNQLTSWLFDTAGKFSAFYAHCSVKNAESTELRQSRLILCDLMARALSTGLSLLGIETADVM